VNLNLHLHAFHKLNTINDITEHKYAVTVTTHTNMNTRTTRQLKHAVRRMTARKNLHLSKHQLVLAGTLFRLANSPKQGTSGHDYEIKAGPGLTSDDANFRNFFFQYRWDSCVLMQDRLIIFQFLCITDSAVQNFPIIIKRGIPPQSSRKPDNGSYYHRPGKVKLFLCLTKHRAMKTYWGSGCIAPRILNLRTRWWWVVNFPPRQFYPRGNIRHRYPLDRRLGGHQSLCGRGGKIAS
jgi:hypothetical protein